MNELEKDVIFKTFCDTGTLLVDDPVKLHQALIKALFFTLQIVLQMEAGLPSKRRTVAVLGAVKKAVEFSGAVALAFHVSPAEQQEVIDGDSAIKENVIAEVAAGFDVIAEYEEQPQGE